MGTFRALSLLMGKPSFQLTSFQSAIRSRAFCMIVGFDRVENCVVPAAFADAGLHKGNLYVLILCALHSSSPRGMAVADYPKHFIVR